MFFSAASDVLPQVSQIILGGLPWRSSRSMKSLSFVMTMAPAFLAARKIC